MINNKLTRLTARPKHIRQQLELLYQQKHSGKTKPIKDKGNYNHKGLGLNWRVLVIFVLALFHIGLYQVQAHAQDCFNLDDIDTSMMLSYNQQANNYSALELLTSEYQVNITGIVAEVTIIQTFLNNSTTWIEQGMYAFPVAHNAAVYDMKLVIGKRVIEGEIHEKQQAQQIYETAKSQGLAASIVKQYRPNLFTTDVANIMPNEQVRVEITYQQTLKYDAGHIDFRLPLAIKSRYMQAKYLQDTNTPIANIHDDKTRTISVNLEAGFELSELKSLYHDVDIQQFGAIQTIVLNDKQLYDANDFVLRWYPTRGNEPLAAMFSENIMGDEYVLMMLLPPKNIQKISQKREVVFIIDTSGSMHGQALNAAKDALLFGLTQIQTDDKFNIIEFNSFARELFTHSVFASANNLDQAIDFIDSLKSDGGTNMAPALSLAMQDKVNKEYLKQIIFVTDGSVGNEAQIFKQINQQIDVARLFTVAIGAAPNNYFMSKAALIGRGSYTNIGNLSEVDEGMNELFVKLSSPALTDIMVEWNTEVVQNPAVIPDLYSDQPVIITAKIKDFDSDIVLSGFANKSTFSNSFSFNQDGQSQGIAKLWARNQIQDLTDDYMLGAEVDISLLKDKIIEIALKYHLVSEFTSLVAVDKTPDMSRLVALQAKALYQPDIVDAAYFPQTTLAWRQQLLIGLFLVGMALVARRFS